MRRKMELISIAIAAAGAILLVYATVFADISRTAEIWLSYIAACLLLLAPFYYAQQKEWEKKGKEPQKFSARVRTILWQEDIHTQPQFFAVVPLADKPIAYAVSAAMYLQLRNGTESACMIDSYSIEAKSDRGKWETMQVWNVPGPEGRPGEEIYSGNDPKNANHLQPVESFTDNVKAKNLNPGETVQGLIFLTMPHDWMAGEFRMRIEIAPATRRLCQFIWTPPVHP